MNEVPKIQISNIQKHFTSVSGSSTRALSGVDLDIYENEFFVIVGPSGSGKSTLLRLIAGLEIAERGNIQFNHGSPKIGFIFQNDTVFPWYTVSRNIGFAMEVKGEPFEMREKKIAELTVLVGLTTNLLSKYPKELSGGEKRRVAIAMALAHDANILLLDEPTSSLDDLNKWHFQEIMQTLQLEKKITCIMVTHDIEEAIFLGDRIAVFNAGAITEIVRIDLPKSRSKEIREKLEFQSIRSQIRKLL
jgi:ABC-type nitrate/sulfonate/bicarbonate transport system ATPase subunit